jgi:hypothetical protein
MRFACPHCNKVLLVKDEHAGKTGKCPECGQRITSPEQDDRGGDGQVPPENTAQGEVEPDRFAQTKDSAEAPGAGGRRLGSVLVAVGTILVLAAAAGAAYWYWTAPARIPIPAISMYNVDADRYVQRSMALDSETIVRWQVVLKEATGEYLTSREIFFLLPNINGLWEQDTWSEAASTRYLGRFSATPLHALRDWRTEILRASGGRAGSTLSDVLTRLVEIDRLYNGNRFDASASDLLLSRLRELPVSTVESWARVMEAEKGQAALSLAMMDPLFSDGRFDTNRFEKKLRWTQGR